MSNQNENSSQLTIHVIAKAKSGQENKVRQLCESILAPTRQEPGCINYYCHQDPKDPTQFMFYENWTNQAALDAHLVTPHITKFFQEVSDLLEKPPEIFAWKLIG